MTEFFLKVLNMSISASWIVLAVLLLRILLKKAPKWIRVVLWGIVGIRLILPFSLESVMSLIPSAQTVSPEIIKTGTPQINSGFPMLNSVLNPVAESTAVPPELSEAVKTPWQTLLPLLAVIWLCGIALLLTYSAVSYLRIRRRVATAVLLRDSIYQSEAVNSPFVLGILKPKIYLPFGTDEQKAEYIIAHEKSHIRRKDHLWKPFGFAVLSLHWFNPLMWLAYVLLCRDIELACDEKVIKELNTDCRADYSQALLSCSIKRRSIAACPLAFGEVGVKQRIKGVLNYKKPAFWLIAVALISCTVLAVCFLTNPKDKPKPSDNVNPTDSANQPTQTGEDIFVLDSGSDREDVHMVPLCLQREGDELTLEVQWDNNSDYVIRYGEPFKIMEDLEGEWVELDNGGASWNLPAYPVNPLNTEDEQFREMNRKFTYNLSGVYDLNQSGKYRFVTDFCYDYDGTKQYNVWVDFFLSSSADDTIRPFYYENGTLDMYDRATLSLFPQTKEFRFSCSLLLSYYGGGMYEEKGDKILCRTLDGKYTYTFKKQGDTYVFLADESSALPEYKYNGADSEPKECVPDGAVFISPSRQDAFNTMMNLNAVIDRISFDVDNDGVEEACSLKYGPTSGLFTFVFEISKEGKREYFNVFISPVSELKFISENGELKLQGSGTFDDPTPRIYDISFADGNIVLTHNGESMGYWGMQGI